MKIIPLKRHEESYTQVLIELLRSPADARIGATYEEQKLTVPLIEALEGVGDNIEVEISDDEWKWLCDRLKLAPFKTNNRMALDMINDVLEAKDG